MWTIEGCGSLDPCRSVAPHPPFTGPVSSYSIREISPEAIVWTRRSSKSTSSTTSRTARRARQQNSSAQSGPGGLIVENGDEDDDLGGAGGGEDGDEEEGWDLEKALRPGHFMAFLLVVKDDPFSRQLDAVTTGKLARPASAVGLASYTPRGVMLCPFPRPS